MAIKPVPAGFEMSAEYKLLRDWWADSGKTQGVIARELGVDQPTVSRFLNPERDEMIHPDQVRKLLPNSYAKKIMQLINEQAEAGEERWKVRRPVLSVLPGYELLRNRVRGRSGEGAFVLSAHNMDYVLEVIDILDDHEESVDEARRLAGGSGANTGCGLATLGIPVSMGGIVSDDADGKDLRQNLVNHGVDVTPLTILPGEQSGKATILAKQSGASRAIYVQPGVNESLAEVVLGEDQAQGASMYKAISSSKIVHVSSFTADPERKLLKALPGWLDGDQLLAFTPQMHAAELGLDALKELYVRVNILFVYAAHLKVLVDRTLTIEKNADPVEALFEWRRRMSGSEVEPLVVAVKDFDLETREARIVSNAGPRAEREVTIFTSTQEGTEYSTPRRLSARSRQQYLGVDSTGAGDAMAAGLMFGLLRDLPVEDSTDLAQLMALIVGSGRGARETLPNVEQVQAAWRSAYGTKMPNVT